MATQEPRNPRAVSAGDKRGGVLGSLSRLFLRPVQGQTQRHVPQPRPRKAISSEHGFIPRLIRMLGVHTQSVGDRLERWAAASWLAWLPVRLVAGLLGIGLMWIAVTTPLEWWGQLLFALLLWVLALVIRRLPGQVPTLALISIAMIASCRYGWWRVTQSMELDPGWESVLGWTLLGAEFYAWLVMALGFVQSAWPLGRQPLPMPDDRSQWPTVDVFVPTYQESLDVLKPTVLAAMGMDWPAEKLNVYVLDDGARPEVREFAAAVGVRYIARTDNRDAKAGNLNHAMQHSNGAFIAIFDCDHMPTRAFLTTTMGWMLKDAGCAMVQTPQHFFSPDPFERNLDTFRRIPNEGKLFYGVVQDGNDFWNAAFFCGSCAVVRRQALEEIGGIATDTVTEDAHTALKLHRRGYRTAYVNSTQAAGLATETLAGHIRQRVRWARGMAQIFRRDNPLLGRGLSVAQRLCYSNAMLHFFYGIPRLVFLTAPLAYLFFELHIIRATAVMILAFALPHVVLPHIANAHINGQNRHTFWAEVYETVLAWYVALPTTFAFLNPEAGKFNVTAKGGLIEESHFDWRISRPYLLLIGLNLAGFIFGIVRLFYWNAEEAGTVLLNLAWTAYNLAMLGAAMGVARERRQVRRAHRVSSQVPVALRLPEEGRTILCRTRDYSMSGLGVQIEAPIALTSGQVLEVVLSTGEREHAFKAKVTNLSEDYLGLTFQNLSLADEAALIQCTFARVDAWENWQEPYEADRALQGLEEIVRLGAFSYGAVMREGLRRGTARLGQWARPGAVRQKA